MSGAVGVIEDRTKNALAQARLYNLSITKLKNLENRKKVLQKSDRWYDLDEMLTAMGDESAKLLSYVSALGTTQERITTLGERQRKANRKVTAAAIRTASTRRSEREATEGPSGRQRHQRGTDGAGRQAPGRRGGPQRGRRPGRPAPAAPHPRAVAGQQPCRGADRPGHRAPSAPPVRSALRSTSRWTRSARSRPPWARKWGAYHGNGEGNLPGAAAGLARVQGVLRPPRRNEGRHGRAGSGRRSPPVVSDSTGVRLLQPQSLRLAQRHEPACVRQVTDP